MRVIILLILFGTCFLLSAGYGEARPAKATSSLTVEEYELISIPREVGTGTVNIIESYNANKEIILRKVKKFQKKREKWRKRTPADKNIMCSLKISCINDELKKFNYRLLKKKTPENNHYYEFFKGDHLVITFSHYEFFGVNKQKSEFYLTANKYDYESSVMIRILLHNETVQTWATDYQELVRPIFIGDSLLAIVPGKTKNYILEKDAIPIYQFSVLGRYVYGDIYNFFSAGDDWIIEYEENVVVNGENIGKQKDYSKVFNYRTLKEKPFYFFKQNSKIRISYDNHILPNSYESVLHYMCCETGAVLSPRENENMTMFFAFKNGHLYYVEAGVY